VEYCTSARGHNLCVQWLACHAVSASSCTHGWVRGCAGLGSVKYGIVVETGDEFWCGTNANVFITVYGSNGDSGKRPLTPAKRSAFDRNQKANFELEAVDLGI